MVALDSLPILDVERLDVASLPAGTASLLRVALVQDGVGDPIRVPVMVMRGAEPGPTVGLTAAVHGNELNGARVVHRVFKELNGHTLRGTVVGVPIVNIPGFVRHQRELNDGADLNLAMPGRPDGKIADVYAHRLLDRVVSQLDHLIDLHTASFGRVNSVYVRADLTHPQTAWMARSQHPHIIVHHTGADGTLRSAAMSRGISAITVEIGDPQLFQQSHIDRAYLGVANVLARLRVVAVDEHKPEVDPIVCARSYWLYTDAGGLLDVYPKVTARVRSGEIIARLTDAFGRVQREYRAPEDGVVVGRSTNPVAQTGARILHLGVEGEPDHAVPRGDIE